MSRPFSIPALEQILSSDTNPLPDTAFFLLDSNWCFQYINEQALIWLNRSRSELIGQNLWAAFPSLSGSLFEQEYRKAVETKSAVIFEGFSPTRKAWFEVHAYPGEDNLSVYFQDISVRRHLEERLHLLESAVVHAKDTFIITEAQSIDEPGPRILYVNEAFSKMTGYSAEEAIGRSPRFLQGPDTSREALDQIRAALENWRPTEVELLNYRKDSSTFWAQMSVVPVADESGKFTHIISIQRDVSERKEYEAALQQAKVEAEQANIAKSEFLSRMSHELRTPLNAILGFSQLLEMSSLCDSNQDQENVQHVLRAGRHLLGLINEVLDISRGESGHWSVSLEPVEVDTILKETLPLVRSLAVQMSVVLENVPAPLMMVQADQQRLKQVLLNLLSNAIKYNRSGGVVTIWCEAQENDHLRISIHDEGEGIAPEKQHRLFTPFDRLDAETSGIDGVGIGLALSQRLVQFMGGTLGFESRPRQGSTFWIELPLVSTSKKLT